MSDVPTQPEPEPDPGPADEPDDMPDDEAGDEGDGTPPAGEQGAQGDADGKPRA